MAPGVLQRLGTVEMVLRSAILVGLLVLGFCRFFAGTSFTQDDFVWLFFCKFYPTPYDIFWRDTLCGQFFRPVGQLWYLGVHAVAGKTLWPYQVGFLSVHLVTAVLAARLARRLTGSGGTGFVFLFFALNPMFFSPISNYYCYVFDLLGFGFYLLALLLTLKAAEKDSGWIGAAALTAALASYLSKEAFFTLPAAVVLVLGFHRAEEGWRWSTVVSRGKWVVLHTVVLAVAVLWRWMVIGNVGGYAWASLTGGSDVVAHLIERTTTFLGFAGWSLIPHLDRPTGQEFWPLLGSVLALGVLSWWSRRASTGPGPVWVWVWMVVTWMPSMLMTTYAAVSWYACSFGTVLLLSQTLQRFRGAQRIGLGIGFYFAVSGFAHYEGVDGYIARLRDQQRALTTRFPEGGWAWPQGERVYLLGSCADLYPDPIVKYATPRGRPVADVLFLNDRSPVDWVMTNDRPPENVRPFYVSKRYQTGYIDMHQFRGYPLVHDGQTDYPEILRRTPPFRFLKWRGEQLIDVTDQYSLDANPGGDGP